MANFFNKIWDNILNFLENNKIYRVQKGAIFAGVCQGLAIRTGIRVELIRLVWLLSLIPTITASIIIYIVLAMIMPKKIVQNYRSENYIDGNAWEKK